MKFSPKSLSIAFVLLLSLAWSMTATAQQSLNFPAAESGDYISAGSTGIINGVVATSFQGHLYAAFEATNNGTLCNSGGTNPCLCVTPNNSFIWNCPGYLPVMDGQPQITVWNNKIYIAFAAASSHQLVIATSTDGYGYTYTEPAGIAVAPGPAIGVFNGKLYVAYQQNASSHYLGVISSTDGVNFTGGLNTSIQIGHSPALIQFGTKLVIADFCQCSGHSLDVHTSTDGVNFSTTEITSQTLSNISAPSLMVYNNVLALAYVKNGTNDIYTSTSYDAANWTTAQRQSNNLSFSLGGSSLVNVGGTIYIAYESERPLSYDPHSAAHQEYYSSTGPIQ